MRTIALFFGTLLLIASIPSGLAVLVGVLAIADITDVPAAVANVLVFGGVIAAGMFSFAGTWVCRRYGADATNLEYQLGVGLPLVLAGLTLALYSGEVYDLTFSFLLLMLGLGSVIIGFVQCFSRIDRAGLLFVDA